MLRRSAVLTLLAILALVVPAEAAFAANALDSTFTGATTPTPIAPVGEAPGEHSDADVVYAGGHYVIFYRKHQNGHSAIWRAESSSPSGAWTGDAPVIVPGQAGVLGCDGAYAPSVTVRADNVLFMVYEADPKTGLTPTNCETNAENSNQYVAYAQSTDNGHTWTNYKKLFWYSTNVNGANIGTPEMQILTGNQVEVSWHVNPGAAGPANPLFRQATIFPSGDPATLYTNPNSHGAVIREHFNWPNGADITTTYGFYAMDGGTGRADYIKGPDGYFYAIIEAFGGGVPLCGELQREGVFLARSTSITGPYTLSTYLMSPQINSQCTQDMPQWYTTTTGKYRFLLTNQTASPNRIDFREL